MHSHASLMAHYNPRRSRTVLDPIHSHIEFDEQMFFINTNRMNINNN